MAADLPIYTWRDDIDEKTYMVGARCYQVRNSYWRGLTVWLMMDEATIPRWRTYQWREVIIDKFMKELAGNCMGILPLICRVNDDPTCREWGLG